jgi:cobalt-zinc-cadmium efflux system membrane fusion protein
MPTVAVAAALGALAVWGHSTGWTLPKFSALVGSEDKAATDWCEEHNVPESQCIECNPKLAPKLKDYGWCKEHGIAQCPLEHPDVAQLATTPTITSDDVERANRALALRPRAENNSRCVLYQRRIQFASDASVTKTGVETAVVEQHPVVEAIVANGQVIYDETHAAHLASRVAGTVWRVEKRVGDRVKTGDILAYIDSAEVGRAKAEFLQAFADLRLTQATLSRLQPLAGGAVAMRQIHEAEAACQKAEIRLVGAQQTLVNLGLPIRTAEYSELNTEQIAQRIQVLGLPQEIVGKLNSDSTTSNLFPLRSPQDGVIIARTIVPGEVVDTNTTIFGVADVQQLWLILDVRQEDAQDLALGQKVLFRPSASHTEKEISGSVDWISTEADNVTRTVKVRANLPNQNGKVRANTFGTGRIVLRDDPHATVVPNEAVHSDGDCHIVFVRDKNYLRDDAAKFFHVRQVRIGTTNGDETEIIAGVLPGEVVASKNSAVLEAQLLKGNLAGDE